MRNEPVTSGRIILVPLDDPARTVRRLREASRMARDAYGQIILTTVLDLDLTTVHRARDLEHAIFRAFEDRAKVMPDVGVPTKVDVIVSADVAGSLITHASSSRADLIAMMTHARGSIGEFVFGSCKPGRVTRLSPLLFTTPFGGDDSYGAQYPDVPASVRNLATPLHDVSHL